MNHFLISWQIICPGPLLCSLKYILTLLMLSFPFVTWFFMKVGTCRCGKFSLHVTGILAGIYRKVLLDFFSDSELGLHHSVLKPNSLLAETGDKKKDKERNKLEEETTKE